MCPTCMYLPTHQIEDSSVVILLEELVFAFLLFVSDKLWIGSEQCTSFFFCHVVHLLQLLLLSLQPDTCTHIHTLSSSGAILHISDLSPLPLFPVPLDSLQFSDLPRLVLHLLILIIRVHHILHQVSALLSCLLLVYSCSDQLHTHTHTYTGGEVYLPVECSSIPNVSSDPALSVNLCN